MREGVDWPNTGAHRRWGLPHLALYGPRRPTRHRLIIRTLYCWSACLCICGIYLPNPGGAVCWLTGQGVCIRVWIYAHYDRGSGLAEHRRTPPVGAALLGPIWAKKAHKTWYVVL